MLLLNKFIFICIKYFIFFVQCKRPDNNRLLTTWRLECEQGIIIDSDCPIDGGWSPWAPWSSCHGACDNIGHRKRIRECNNPSPSKDGLPCNGLDVQIKSCYPENCSVESYRTIVEGDVMRTEALKQLEIIPEFMERCLKIECPYEAVEAALAAENTWQLNSEALWNALQCVKHDLGCFVKGVWGAWGPWSTCGAQCGKGFKWRVRRCDTPPPSASHLICQGVPLQTKECEGDQCAIDEQHTELTISGTWGEWGEWTKCSEKCGPGVHRRKRTCIENHNLIASLTWTTHCHGPYEELEICNVKNCLLNGGWSGWAAWGPCSQTCGTGKRSRTRSCTRPIPSDGGTNCQGLKVEVGSCHLNPCQVYKHAIAAFNGDSVIKYDFTQKSSSFFHLYMRFMALSPHGTLIHRGEIENPRVRISLYKWHVCVDVSGMSKSCNLPRTCSPSELEPSAWHSILIAVTNEVVTLRINDAQIPIQNLFPCDPELPNDKVNNIFLGDKFHGEIQEVILNFISVYMIMEYDHKGASLSPTSVSNIMYQNADMKEAYVNLENQQYLRLPCFDEQDEWQLELTIKSKRASGIILFLLNSNSCWFYMVLQSTRLVIKYTSNEFKSEAFSSNEYLPYEWLDIKLYKRKDTNAIEVSINSGERLHVVLTENTIRNQRMLKNSSSYYFGQNKSSDITLNHTRFIKAFNHTKDNILCHNEYFIGGIPLSIISEVSEDLAPFFGTIASLKIDNDLIDLHSINMERYNNEIIQLSSRTASISGIYKEIFWGESNMLNLTCVHSRSTRSSHPAYWLYLDNGIENKTMSSLDNGKVLRLLIFNKNSRPGFYTCRAYDNHTTRNFITYAIYARNNYRFTGPDALTIIAVCTTVFLVLFTLTWLILEGYHDIHNGYGFFRDDQLSSEELVEKIRDQRMQVNRVENKYSFCNSKARRRRRQPCVKAMIGDQELLNISQKESSHEYTQREPDVLPALPKLKSSVIKTSHEIYRFETSDFSSPLRSPNITSHKTKLSSSSSNLLYSRLFLSNLKSTEEEISKMPNICNYIFDEESKPTLLKRKSSSMDINNTPVQIVLNKFKKLKSSDP